MELEKAAHAPATHPSRTLEGKAQENPDEQQEERIQRREQAIINKIMKGEEKGHYYLLLGPKGSGKTSMMIQAVSRDSIFVGLHIEKLERPCKLIMSFLLTRRR
jgi:predicted AAA+ superfamily ATPase